MADNKLYLVDTQGGTATAVFDFDVFSVPNVPAMPQILRMNRQGTRLLVTLNGAGKVVMFNIARPDRPELMSVADLGPGSGPIHASHERRETARGDGLLSGRRPSAGRHRERGGRSQDSCGQRPRESLELDTAFDVEFDRDISTGPARPHGLVLLSAWMPLRYRSHWARGTGASLRRRCLAHGPERRP
jgi:hypothetical protein